MFLNHILKNIDILNYVLRNNGMLYYFNLTEYWHFELFISYRLLIFQTFYVLQNIDILNNIYITQYCYLKLLQNADILNYLYHTEYCHLKIGALFQIQPPIGCLKNPVKHREIVLPNTKRTAITALLLHLVASQKSGTCGTVVPAFAFSRLKKTAPTWYPVKSFTASMYFPHL